MLGRGRILLIVGGGIAAYKSLELIRRLRERDYSVRTILTRAGAEFVTKLSLSALSEERVYDDLFSLTDEQEMGHIRLSREADLIVVAPATADLMAKMAAGLADDLATTCLLATDKPVLIAPSMNVMMWSHAATRANHATLLARGIGFIGPASGDLACGEIGSGRLSEVPEIIAAIEATLGDKPLKGLKMLVTSGPTREPIDPIRYLSNRSSGRQGHAIAASLARAGAEVRLIAGPTEQPDPPGVAVTHVETAIQMLGACEAALPVDAAICVAAVADWRPAEAAPSKLKKRRDAAPPVLELVENPDILATLSRHTQRPRLVVGFAAETDHLLENGQAKLAAKGCDWILANPAASIGSADNTIDLIDTSGIEHWPAQSKEEIAQHLALRVARFLMPQEGQLG
jgi:phosphopantothenoylcysteine decarboxylase/phosphopantothenate--cysteine ligase